MQFETHVATQEIYDIPFGGIGASGTGARFGGAANLEAFTDTRWVTVRGDIAPYPF
jgi:benzaldehyde dehydrogenase (NAD)